MREVLATPAAKTIESRVIELGISIFNETTEDIIGMLGYDDPSPEDIIGMDRLLKRLGLKSKWTFRAGGRCKVWYSLNHWRGKPKKRVKKIKLEPRRPKKVKLTPRVKPHTTTQ